MDLVKANNRTKQWLTDIHECKHFVRKPHMKQKNKNCQIPLQKIFTTQKNPHCKFPQRKNSAKKKFHNVMKKIFQ